ncbi:MAG: hypothetical protein KDD53_11455, partial [Bdellovibrionales bacterium]|nr:hypothetical protein [Bdellovibrionales bacterium]
MMPIENASDVYDPLELTAKQRIILSSVELNARKPLKSIATESSCSVQEVKSEIENLSAHGVIQMIPVVDLFRLGFTDYTLWFSLDDRYRRNHGKIIDLFVRSNTVAWIAEFTGQYGYGCSIRASTIGQVGDTLDSLFLGHSDIV